MKTPTEQKPCIWSTQYIIDNLPSWIYTDNEQPKTIAECKAKISAIQYTLKDIDLQVEIRELELKTGNSRHSSSFEFEQWKSQALRAKQTHTYLLNAYSYWLIYNEREHTNEDLDRKINKIIQLLLEDPEDFIPQLEKLL